MMPSSIVSLLESSQQINGGQVPDAIEAGRRRSRRHHKRHSRSRSRRHMRGGAAPEPVEGGSSIVSPLESSQQINGGQVPDAIEAGRRSRSRRHHKRHSRSRSRRHMRGGAAPEPVEGGAAPSAAPVEPAVEGGAVNGGFFFDNVEGGKRAYRKRSTRARNHSKLMRSIRRRSNAKCPRGSRKDTRKGALKGSCRKVLRNGRLVAPRQGSPLKMHTY